MNIKKDEFKKKLLLWSSHMNWLFVLVILYVLSLETDTAKTRSCSNAIGNTAYPQ